MKLHRWIYKTTLLIYETTSLIYETAPMIRKTTLLIGGVVLSLQENKPHARQNTAGSKQLFAMLKNANGGG